MEVRPCPLPGCYEILTPILHDNRGTFCKTFLKHLLKEKGMQTEFPEEFYSTSEKNVIRGLHVQTPPGATVKMVYCPYGEVFDVIVDLRKGSPTYGKFHTFRLSPEAANELYIPEGVAHGFCVLSTEAVLVYRASQEHDQRSDTGIRFDSLDIPWPSKKPIVSDRDRSLPAFGDFRSPFTFQST
ncbi:MAG: dTDP-4-dehydrorhamnose 3,5-epimerase family protein [Candidatus Peribacter sp.]|nr:dTDP-4-dehydrorhamnose 3,5-epimerase family protein [Candidatus Peribacter sp.]